MAFSGSLLDRIAIQELDPIVENGDNAVAQWEGVFQFDDHVYILECTHRVTAVSTPLLH